MPDRACGSALEALLHCQWQSGPLTQGPTRFTRAVTVVSTNCLHCGELDAFDCFHLLYCFVVPLPVGTIVQLTPQA